MNYFQIQDAKIPLSLEPIPDLGDVLLVILPFVWTEGPIGGIHILQAACRQSGLIAPVLYSNLHFLSLINGELHRLIASDDYYLMNERLFARAAYNTPSQVGHIRRNLQANYIPDHLWPPGVAVTDDFISSILSPFRDRFRQVDWERLEDLSGQWVEVMAAQIVQKGYPIVGCSTTHGGLAAAVALLKSIKEKAPQVITILGGALCEAEMARGILSLQTPIDYIFSGEGDISFPILIQEILHGKFPDKKILYGSEVERLDESPIPDFQDFFSQRAFFFPQPVKKDKTFGIPYETSRGCWYRRCTFCGLMGLREGYRKKSPDKIIKDLTQLTRRFPVQRIYFTDNMMTPQYYETLFPRISAEVGPLELLFEIKARITWPQLLTLRQAGTIFLQAGIESLSPSLLERMDKGVSLAEVLQLLRFARSLNMELKWNILFGFPGDRSEEYRQMLELLPYLRHLQPPRILLPVRICRDSRYHLHPDEFGITNLRPAAVHREILPQGSRTEDLAYFFLGEYPSDIFHDTQLLLSLKHSFQDWQDAWNTFRYLPLDTSVPRLHITRQTTDVYILEDSRGTTGNVLQTPLNREQALFLLHSCPLAQCKEKQLQRALAAHWGIVIQGMFIPLSTADKSLLEESELMK